VHVMAPATAELLADVANLESARVRTIPHPSYAGVYGGDVDRCDARTERGLQDGDRAALFFGQIRPYKGVQALVEAGRRARACGAPVTVLLAGIVKEQSDEEFRTSLPEDATVVSALGHVPDDAVPGWFAAADVVVLPYRSVLNSGSIHLAATFRVPVLLPDEPHLRSQFGLEPWVEFFDRGDPAGSIARLLTDPGLFRGVTAADFDAFLEGIDPATVAASYRALLDELTGRPSA
jgi:beta-1,4-mannosyltransferase